jgi:Bifunctional DNA primase/polymerase, N-terminal/AAA domain/Primase C terminal 1 (PriCT-1)
MNLTEVALELAGRGWYVFPCRPKTKEPAIVGGWKNASNNEAQVRTWWKKWPEANVGIATAPSGLCVLDVDHGFANRDDVLNFIAGSEIPKTYIVKTGRTDGYGVQFYFNGRDLRSIPWRHETLGISGDIRCSTGYVMAAGSVHPSGGVYEVWDSSPCAPLPAFVRGLRAHRVEIKDDEPITEGRNNALTSIGGKLRHAGLSAAALEVSLLQVNADRCVPPLDDDEVRRIAANASRWALPEEEPRVVLGKSVACSMESRQSSEFMDWQTRYMTEEQYLNVKPPSFLIDGFLAKGSIAMLGGPVAQRKSIVALNVAHALCTGEALFGYFKVREKPIRTVYLCPEMGAASFVKRVRQIGLSAYVGKTLFIQTMNEQATTLDELNGELPGAVVIIDTITRFLDGDESKSDDMRKFAQKVFRLANSGATMLLLHHSKKGSSGTLDDGLRGSSELAAFVDSCWITELEDTKRPYDSLSKMRNVKQRDFESDPFRLKPTPGEYRLTVAEDPAPDAVIADKKEAAAREALSAILKEHSTMGINKLREALKAKGFRKGNKWVSGRLTEMRGGGAILSSD